MELSGNFHSLGSVVAQMLTFMDYDDVSCNKNFAEHAVKPFARFRRFADGRFTEA